MSRLKFEENEDLSKFLEQALTSLYKHKLSSLAIFATREDGCISCSYWNCSVPDKLVYAGYMQQDATLDTLEALEADEYYEDDPEESEEDFETDGSSDDGVNCE